MGTFAAATGMTSVAACELCQPGQFSPPASSSCDFCSSGQADVDSDPATQCVDCQAGTYAGCGETECATCPAGQVDSDENAATPCTLCLAGQYWENATANAMSQCVQCPAGKVDSDSDSITPCVDCNITQYCGEGAVSPVLCTDSGAVDDDSDPSTPCVTEVLGTAAVEAEVTLDLDINNLGSASARADFDERFKTDMATLLNIDATRVQVSGIHGGSVVVAFIVLPAPDGSSLTPAQLEAAFNSGVVSLAGATTSNLSEPTASSVDLAACMQVCLPGLEDDDCDTATPCKRCEAGQYSPGGQFSAATQCAACNPGTFAPEGSLATDCTGCSQGKADIDRDSWTECIECQSNEIAVRIDPTLGGPQRGSFGLLAESNATRCYECPAGKYRQENNVDGVVDCIECEVGKFNNVSGRVSIEACQECAAGTWSPDSGYIQCPPCSTLSFRRSVDIGCQPCSNEAYRCDHPGMIIPEAAAGHFVRVEWPEDFAAIVPDYVEMTLKELAEQYQQCMPFEACVGDCQKDQESGNYDVCEGALGEDRCAPGYEGNRCSVCTPFDEARSGDCLDDHPNGYYRLDKIC
eukprot:COSAG02_NODE_1374_length_13005_cov_5.606152_12_plen_578_part_01